jgi:hypothetical protein
MKLNILIVLTAVICGSSLTYGAPIIAANQLMQGKQVASASSSIKVEPFMKMTPEQSRLINGPYAADPIPKPDNVQRIHKVGREQT